jgi:3-oxoacyl-[acyl-carrier protein] reductase
MDLGIAGRKAIVCASSRGLGRGCAMALAAEGCEVVINGRDPEVLARTADEIRAASGATVHAVAADLADRAGQERLFAACPEPDILVNNNAGPPFRTFTELDRQQMIDGLTANMIIAIELTQRAIEPMKRRGFGRIVNIASSSVKQPIPGLDLSSGARAGLVAFLAGVARTVAGSGVTINNLLPGSFDTDRLRSGMERTARRRGVGLEEIMIERRKEIPVGRFGTPEEFGQACAYLCSMQAGYITGQNLLIDGGVYDGTF